jgi:hypothetical protein
MPALFPDEMGEQCFGEGYGTQLINPDE